jgi:hypothetical protein
MISYRGLAALAVAALFLSFAAVPGAFGPDRPPVALRVLIALAGAGMLGLGALSLVWARRRGQALRHGTPEAATLRLAVDEGSDSTTYDLTLHLPDGDWAVGAAGGAALRGLAPGATYPCRVWRAAPGGTPVAVEIGGRQVQTLPRPRRVTDRPSSAA